MKVRMHAGLAVADAVLLRLRKIRKPKMPEGTKVIVSAWSNCREQGYHFRAYHTNTKDDRAVCVAECRNSDEFIWDNNRTFFDPGQYEEAARHIAGVFAGTVGLCVKEGVQA